MDGIIAEDRGEFYSPLDFVYNKYFMVFMQYGYAIREEVIAMKKYEAPTAEIINFDNDYVVTKRPRPWDSDPRGPFNDSSLDA